MLWHMRSEGISSIQLFESSKYWGLRAKGQSEGSVEGQRQTLRHLASEGTGDHFPRVAWAEQKTEGSQELTLP